MNSLPCPQARRLRLTQLKLSPSLDLPSTGQNMDFHYASTTTLILKKILQASFLTALGMIFGNFESPFFLTGWWWWRAAAGRGKAVGGPGGITSAFGRIARP